MYTLCKWEQFLNTYSRTNYLQNLMLQFFSCYCKEACANCDYLLNACIACLHNTILYNHYNRYIQLSYKHVSKILPITQSQHTSAINTATATFRWLLPQPIAFRLHSENEKVGQQSFWRCFNDDVPSLVSMVKNI